MCHPGGDVLLCSIYYMMTGQVKDMRDHMHDKLTKQHMIHADINYTGPCDQPDPGIGTCWIYNLTPVTILLGYRHDRFAIRGLSQWCR